MPETLTSSVAGIEEMARSAVSAGQNGTWGLAIGLAIMLLIRIASRLNLIAWLPEHSKKWVALAMSSALAVGAGLVANADALTIIVSALSGAGAAIGSWEMTKGIVK